MTTSLKNKSNLPLSPLAKRLFINKVIEQAKLRKLSFEKVRSGDYGKKYTFYGGNKEIFDCKEQEVMLSGAADTGKTLAALCYLNQLCWQYPKAQMAIIRKTAASMPGSVLQTYQKKVIKDDDGIVPYGGEHRASQYIYPNGSIIWVGGLDKASKVLSSERDVIYVNQAEELLLPEWETLITRANGRAGNLPFSMVFGDCNPSAPTHWIKTRAKAGQLKFLEVTHRDNPDIYDPVTGQLTESGERRIRALSGLTGATRLRLFQGIWAQPEGAIYDIFDEEKHKVKPFPIPRHWPRIVGIDPFGAYICALWLAYDPDNNMLVVYREYYEPFGVTTPEHAKAILALSGYDATGRPLSTNDAEPIFIWIGGGPSERQARTDWAAAGIPMQANQIIEVWSQIDKVYQLLKDFKLVIFDTAANLLSEIGSYKRKIVNGVVTNDIDQDENFHALSALRYAVAYLSTPNEQADIVYDPVRIGRYFQQ